MIKNIFIKYKQPLILGAIIAIINIIPYLYGYYLQDENHIFTGTISQWPEDTYGHLSFPKQAQEGEWLFETKWNGNEVSSRMIFSSLFLAMGKLSSITGLSLDIIHHIERSFFSIILVCAIYFYSTCFFEEKKHQLYATLLATFGAGFGFLQPLGILSFTPIDLSCVEMSVFWFMRWEDVVTPSVICILLIFGSFFKYLKTNISFYLIISSIFLFLLFTIHPHDVVIIAMVVLIFSIKKLKTVLLKWKKIFLYYFLAAIIPSIYYLSLLLTEKGINQYVNQINDYPTIPLLLGFGIPLILSSFYVITKKKVDMNVIWFLACFILLMFPHTPLTQAYLLDGLSIPLALLAVKFLIEIKMKNLVVLGIILISSITNIYIFYDDFNKISERPYPYFISKELDDTLYWIDENIDSQKSFVTLDFNLNNLLPYKTGNRIYLATDQQTNNYDLKNDSLNQVFSQLPSIQDSIVLGFLNTKKIDYFLCSNEKIKIVNNDKLVYSNNKFTIYKTSE